MTKIFTCILLLALVGLLSAPVLADQNTTPATTTTTVPTTTATTVATTTTTTVLVTTTTAVPTTAMPAWVASFTGSPASGTAPLTVQFTDTSSGSPISWAWTFGDGGSSTSENPGYTYSAAGSYTVSLTATNAAGSDTATETDYVTVSSAPQAPAASFTGTPTSGIAPLTVQFTDTSSGSPASWSWDFGDGGSSTDENPGYTFTTAGNYTVTLTATNAAGSDTATEDEYIIVSSEPVASFTGSPTSGIAPLTVQFTDTSSGSPASWSWDFGDGGSSVKQDPTYTYTTPGSYTVTLVATNDAGSNTSAEEAYIMVGAEPTLALTLTPTTSFTLSVPVASFIDDPILGTAPLTVQFTDLSEGRPTLWHWDFGDGGSSTEQDPSYTYLTPGFYTVTLTSANSAGNSTSTGTGKITVLSPASTQTPLSPLAVIMAMGIAAIASAGIRGRKQQ